MRLNVHVRFLLIAAAIGVLGGLLLIPVNSYAITLARGIPLLYAPVVGAFLLPVLTSMLSLRRPGAGVLAAFFAGLVNVPSTGWSLRAVVIMVLIGAFLELALALRRYRSWHKRIFAVAITVASVLYGVVMWNTLNVGSIGLPAQIAFFALLVVSSQGALVLSAIIARALADRGVTRGIPWHGGWRSREPLVADGGWRYDGGSASKPDTTP